MTDPFHQHLDTCKRCAANPFDLCPVGHRLLVHQVQTIDAQDERDPEFLDGDPGEP